MNDSFGRNKVALSQMKPSHQGHTGRERGRGEGEGLLCVWRETNLQKTTPIQLHPRATLINNSDHAHYNKIKLSWQSCSFLNSHCFIVFTTKQTPQKIAIATSLFI